MKCISKLMIFFAVLAMPFAVLAEPLPEQIFKALEAGESRTVIVYGTSVSIRGEWANAVERYFNRLYPDQVAFFNTARSGMHSNWGVENLKERVLDKNPDLVFLEFAINDAATKHGISTEQCRLNLDTMVNALKAQNPNVEIVLQTMNPAWDSPKSAPKKYASDRSHLADYYTVYRDYAQENGLPLVDNYPVWKKIFDEEPERYQQLVPDGIHPDSEPSLEVAWPTVKALLDRGRVFADAGAVVPVWPEELMPGAVADAAETVSFPERTDAVRMTNVSRPTLAFYPVTGTDAPAVIVCPGGGYTYCVVDKEGTEIAAWLNSIGISAFVLKYRTPDNRSGALQDIQRSIRLVRTHAEKWNIDPEKVGVIGFSAGGNLCAKASNLFDTPSYAPVDDAGQQSCRPDFAVLVYPAYLEVDGAIASDLNLDAHIPPTLIVHSNDDERFVPGSRIYDEALTEKGHPHAFLLYATGGHGYGLRSELDARVWPVDAAAWLRENGFIK